MVFYFDSNFSPLLLFVWKVLITFSHEVQVLNTNWKIVIVDLCKVKKMPYCPKCGSEVKKENAFCPKCGAALKATVSPAPKPPEYRRNEKAEKNEKQEKHEKSSNEKYEKQQFGVFGPFIGGIVLILVGLMFYLSVSGVIEFRSIFPFVLIIVGVIIIVGVLSGAMKAKQRNPRP